MTRNTRRWVIGMSSVVVGLALGWTVSELRRAPEARRGEQSGELAQVRQEVTALKRALDRLQAAVGPAAERASERATPQPGGEQTQMRQEVTALKRALDCLQAKGG